MKKEKRNILWILLFPVLAMLTLWAIVSGSRGFSWRAFRDYLGRVDPGWLLASVAAMTGYIIMEGLSLWLICRRLGSAPRLGQGQIWASADIFFSAITPSATGGQPAAAMLMMREGIPAVTGTVALLLNLIFYTLTIVLITPLTFLFCPEVLGYFTPLSQMLIRVGFFVQLLLAVFFILLFRGKLIWRLLDGCLHALHRLRLIRDKEKWLKRMEEKETAYRLCVDATGKDTKLLAQVFFLNFLQRLSLLLVPVAICLGTGGTFRLASKVLATQSCVVLGSNIVPLPGGMGVADFLFLDGYESLGMDVVSMELLCRGISFYGSFLLSGVLLLGNRISAGLRKRKKPGSDPEWQKSASHIGRRSFLRYGSGQLAQNLFHGLSLCQLVHQLVQTADVLHQGLFNGIDPHAADGAAHQNPGGIHGRGLQKEVAVGGARFQLFGELALAVAGEPADQGIHLLLAAALAQSLVHQAGVDLGKGHLVDFFVGHREFSSL